MTMFTVPSISYHRTYVIHGPAYELARPGGYWGQGDELSRHCRVGSGRARGVVLIECLDQEDSDRLQLLIDGLGLVAGRDYAMHCKSGHLVDTDLVRWVRVVELFNTHMEPVARIRWAPGTAPAEVQELHGKLYNSLYDVRWPALRDEAIRHGVSAEVLEQASQRESDYERWKYLNDALQTKYRRALADAEEAHIPRILSQTSVRSFSVQENAPDGPSPSSER